MPGLVLVLVLLLVRFSILVLLIPVHSVWIPPQPWHSKFLVLVLFLAGSPAGTKPLKEDESCICSDFQGHEEDAKEEEEQAGAAAEAKEEDQAGAAEEDAKEEMSMVMCGGGGGA